MHRPMIRILFAALLTAGLAAPAFAQDHQDRNDSRDDHHDAHSENAPQPVAHEAPHPTAHPVAHDQHPTAHSAAPVVAARDHHDDHPAPVVKQNVYVHESHGDYGYHRTHDYYRWNHPQEVVVVPAAPIVIYDTDQPYVRVNCNNGSAITGTVIGGIVGALVGNQFGHHRGLPTVGGSLIGALIGNQIGQANEGCAAQALEYAKPDTQVVWNDNNGATYEVVPQAAYQDNGQYCREYQTKIMVEGQIQPASGTACRQPDGTWQTAE